MYLGVDYHDISADYCVILTKKERIDFVAHTKQDTVQNISLIVHATQLHNQFRLTEHNQTTIEDTCMSATVQTEKIQTQLYESEQNINRLIGKVDSDDESLDLNTIKKTVKDSVNGMNEVLSFLDKHLVKEMIQNTLMPAVQSEVALKEHTQNAIETIMTDGSDVKSTLKSLLKEVNQQTELYDVLKNQKYSDMINESHDNLIKSLKVLVGALNQLSNHITSQQNKSLQSNIDYVNSQYVDILREVRLNSQILVELDESIYKLDVLQDMIYESVHQLEQMMNESEDD